MRLYPAIDLMGGEVVRLTRGLAETRIAYAQDPLEQAQRFEAEGATHLHVVDLDAAFRRGDNRTAIARLVAGVALRVQVGGGIRDLAEVARLLDSGVWRVVVGSAAVEQPELVGQAIARFGAECVAVGLDGEAGRLRIKGWTESAPLTVREAASRMVERGVAVLIYTDIARDGMLGEPDVAGAVELARHSGCRVVLSGGVAELRHLAGLAVHPERQRLEGVIVGKALYEGRFTVAQALAALPEAEPC